ncbi:hypothetical protein TSMG0025 [Halocynthia phage JM-2012]|uniref:hypothetical protein n=1 Tax=Halocynthia phage JM-2012 TaxID=1173297 RepID=UPI00025C68E8|nr:hypothetical protein TSMG0025 [Halocynthia phage JM-2012]AFI55308.1 hypothetical protein TSMG0025 [Halocynthia phage JM-2012]
MNTRMTWGEFKEMIDSTTGVTDDTSIILIDLDTTERELPEVLVEPNGLVIT